MSDWETLLEVRSEALKSLEEARKAKLIGKALDAKLLLEVPAPVREILDRYQSSLRELLNVSQVDVVEHAKPEVVATTLVADGTKCERCWNYSVHVGEDRRWPQVCERCSDALSEMGVPPEEAA